MWRRGIGSQRRSGDVAWLLIVAAVSGFLGSAHAAESEVQEANVPAPARQRQLIQMVRHDCGSCHGLTLAGGLGPALVPAVLQDKAVEYLETMILRGRPGTAMPGWQGLLSAEEAHWIARNLQAGFPDER